ncbi:MAG: C26 family cysteine hydrolase domain-containing family [Eubacterium sp.]|nr:C26 family cysteine hydrolase domain-containing family [Eubacterium sp.]
MKIVLYTQRVEIVKNYGERRDCADQSIPRFIEACGYLPVPMPNIWSVAEHMLTCLNPSGIVFTGGNSLEKYGGDAPERDELEYKVLDFALFHGLPVYGFCRGMQVIADYFGCMLEQVQGHVAVRHEVLGELGTLYVNSYHNQACFMVKPPLEVLARAKDGVIEAVCCRDKHILGTMWHPEREQWFCESDMARLQKLFRKEGI